MEKKEIILRHTVHYGDKECDVIDLLKYLLNENGSYINGIKELRHWITENKHNENTKERYLVVDYGLLLAKISELFPGDEKNEK